MGSELAKIKHRISSIESTRKITNAMKLVSSVKLMRMRKGMSNTMDYVNALEDAIALCMQGMKEDEWRNASPLISKPSEDDEKKVHKPVLYVLVTSNMGLCGGYNINVLKYFETLVHNDDEILVIGEKGAEKLKEEQREYNPAYLDLMTHFTFTSAVNLRKDLVSEFTSGKYERIDLVYTHFKNALTFIPSVTTLLPLNNIDVNKNRNVQSDYPPDFYPNKKEVFQMLLPKYLDIVLYERLSEAGTCEEGARRNAMDNATQNADDLRDSLKTEYNKARQAEITNQITEIMAGRINQ